MQAIIKKWMGFMLTGSFTFILAACYGSPVELTHVKSVKAKTPTGQPIPDLRVTLIANNTEQDYSFTSKEGIADFQNIDESVKNYSIKIEDIDGEANLGLFKTKTIDISQNQSFYETTLDQ